MVVQTVRALGGVQPLKAVALIPKQKCSRPLDLRPSAQHRNRTPGSFTHGVSFGRDERARRSVATAPAVAVDVTVMDEDDLVVGMDGHISFLNLLKFVLPTCGLWVVSPVLSLVDTAIVGTRSAIELAALGPGVMLCDQLAFLFSFLGMAVANRTAINLSRRQVKGAGKVVSDALAVGIALGVGFGLVLFFLSPMVLKAVAGEASAELVGPALAYVRIRSLGLPALMVTQVVQAFFLAAQDPFTPLLALLSAGLLNLFGDLWTVNGLGWGIKGAALATAVAQILTAAMLVRALYQPLRPGTLIPNKCVPVSWRWPGWRSACKFIKTCSGILGMLLVKTLMYTILTSLATGLSPVHSGAHHVVMTLFLFFCFIGEAISMAAQTFLPGFIGVPALAWKLALTLQKGALGIACFVGLAAGSFLLFFPFLFTRSPAIAATMIQLVPYFGGVMFLHCVSMMTEGLLLAGTWGSTATPLTCP